MAELFSIPKRAIYIAETLEPETDITYDLDIYRVKIWMYASFAC